MFAIKMFCRKIHFASGHSKLSKQGIITTFNCSHKSLKCHYRCLQSHLNFQYMCCFQGSVKGMINGRKLHKHFLRSSNLFVAVGMALSTVVVIPFDQCLLVYLGTFSEYPGPFNASPY